MTPPQKGFTLVETMVAITVLAVALVGPYMAANNALSASYVARDKLIASSLAQEGMEYVRSVRDNNYLNSSTRSGWMDGLSSHTCYGTTPTTYCTVDPTQGDMHTAVPATAAYEVYSQLAFVPPLRVSTAGLYNQQAISGTNVASRFTRTVQIQELSTTEVRVTVTVSWTSGHQSYSVVVVDNLRDWL